MLPSRKVKVTRLEMALEVMGDSSGAEVDCLQRALAKAQEAARERPLEIQMKECREFISRAEHRVAKLQVRRNCGVLGSTCESQSRVCARKHPGRSAQGVVASMAKSVELHSGEGFRDVSSGAKDFSGVTSGVPEEHKVLRESRFTF